MSENSQTPQPILSAGWIIYYLDENLNPYFLIIKRHALSKKIEWVAPKWKVKPGEDPKNTAIREIYEETWIDPNFLIYQWDIWKINIFLQNEEKWIFNKDVMYFLFKYTGHPNKIKITEWEWYLGIYKWANISEILSLIYYPEMRNLFVKAYEKIKKLYNLK